MFPLLDKAAKVRRPKEGNKKRMSAFMTDELENVISLCTGLDLQFSPNSQKIVLGRESVGEIFYRIRCSVLHEAETPDDIEFKRDPGKLSFSLTPATSTNNTKISVPAQFCEALHLVILGCPEYTAIPQDFAGRRIRFGRHEIMPSQCIGNFQILRQQLLSGVSLDG